MAGHNGEKVDLGNYLEDLGHSWLMRNWQKGELVKSCWRAIWGDVGASWGDRTQV